MRTHRNERIGWGKAGTLVVMEEMQAGAPKGIEEHLRDSIKISTVQKGLTGSVAMSEI